MGGDRPKRGRGVSWQVPFLPKVCLQAMQLPCSQLFLLCFVLCTELTVKERREAYALRGIAGQRSNEVARSKRQGRVLYRVHSDLQRKTKAGNWSRSLACAAIRHRPRYHM